MDSLANIDWGMLSSELEAMQMTHEVFIVAAAISILSGIIVGMFGLKLVRLLSAISGFGVGLIIGAVVSVALGVSDMTVLIIVLGCAIVFAIAGIILYKIGIFIWILGSVTTIVGVLLFRLGLIGFLIGFVLGLIIAILAMKFFDPVIMIITSFVGASSLSSGILMLAGLSDRIFINIVAFVVALALCIFVQFSMHSRKVKKKEEGYARELRETESREKEIDKARRLLEDE